MYFDITARALALVVGGLLAWKAIDATADVCKSKKLGEA